MKWLITLLLFMPTIALGEITTFGPATPIFSDGDKDPRGIPVELEFSTGTLTDTGNGLWKVNTSTDLIQGDTNYIQNTGTPNTTTQVFHVSSANVAGQMSMDDAKFTVGTSSPTGQADGYLDMFFLDGLARIYFFADGKRYYLPGILEAEVVVPPPAVVFDPCPGGRGSLMGGIIFPMTCSEG